MKILSLLRKIFGVTEKIKMEYPHYKIYYVEAGGLKKPNHYKHIAKTSEELKDHLLTWYNTKLKYSNVELKQYCIQYYRDRYDAEIVEVFKLKRDELRTYYI